MKVVYVCQYCVHVHLCAYVVAMVMSPQEYIPLPLPEEASAQLPVLCCGVCSVCLPPDCAKGITSSLHHNQIT